MDNREWLAFSFTLPSKNQAGRMRVWRRLNALGAVIIKNAFYILPHSPPHHEQFTWLANEVEELGGEAVYWITRGLENVSSGQIATAFTQARDADWAVLEEELRALIAQSEVARPDPDTGDSSEPSGADAGPDQERSEPGTGHSHERSGLEAARRKYARRAEVLKAIDFFPGGRDQAVAALLDLLVALAAGKLPDEASTPIPRQDPASYQGKVWITRPRPYIDRLASFWLVRRFVDAKARIAFVPHGSKAPRQDGTVRFDMAEAEFTHVGGLITFEVITAAFGLEEAIPAQMRETIRAIDLDGPQSGPAEAAGLKRLLDGLTALHACDTQLTEQALTVFDALLASYASPPQANG